MGKKKEKEEKGGEREGKKRKEGEEKGKEMRRKERKERRKEKEEKRREETQMCNLQGLIERMICNFQGGLINDVTSIASLYHYLGVNQLLSLKALTEGLVKTRGASNSLLANKHHKPLAM